MKIFVWSHIDLDGVVSYMVVKWYYKKSIPCKFTTPQNFREEFSRWSKDNFDKYDRIYILDMDITGCEDLVDFEKVVILDHHTTHTAEYKKAKSGVTVSSSAAKLAYKIFSNLPNADYTTPQKTMIALADDYDSYTLKVPQSYELNVVLFESQNKPFNFIKDFEKGFTGFNQFQQNTVTLHKRKKDRIINSLEPFHGTVKIQGKDRHVVSCFASACINEVAVYLIDKWDAEVALVLNVDSNHVSFRRSKTSDVDLSKLAQTLADGGGRAETAGGQLTEKFQEFTKLLEPLV